MKQIIFSVVFYCMLASCMSVKRVNDKYTKEEYPYPFEFSMVDTVALSKDEIYVRCHEWVAKRFGSAKAVIDMQDKQAGKIIGKPGMTDVPTLGVTTYIISVDVKDGRYKVVLSDFEHKNGNQVLMINGIRTVEPISYGDLGKESWSFKDSKGKVIRYDEVFYGVKNDIMKQSKILLQDLKYAVRKQTDEF